MHRVSESGDPARPVPRGTLGAIPSRLTSAAYVPPALGDIRHSRTTCGLGDGQ